MMPYISPPNDDTAAHSHITLRELRDLLRVDPPAIDVRPDEARPGDLVTIKDLSGSRFLSLQKGVLVGRADLNADVRNPVPIKPESVVAIHHRAAEGDFVIIESLATPRLGRVEGIEHEGAQGGPVYVVRTFLDGRRWANARMRFGANDLWPVPAEAATGLLTKMGLPVPPAIRATGSVALAERQPPVPPAGQPLAAIPPMAPGEFADTFARVAYPAPFRRYQSMALDAFDQARAAGRRRAYLVLPPGAGKTLIGLEIARRLGNRCLILGPNTAIQEQWVRQWTDYQPALVKAGDTPDLAAPITALTYQAICDLASHNPLLDQQVAEWQADVEGEHPAAADANPHHRAEVARVRAHARMLIAGSGDHEKLLSILHPNGQQA